MKIDKQSVDKLLKAPYNPRKELKPGDVEYTKLKNSIEKFGYVEPIIVNDRTGYIVGGHQRLSVLKDLGYTEVEVVHVDLDDAHEKALNIALNKVSGDWDADKLEDLLRDINLNSDLDVTFTGFGLDELDTLFGGSFTSEGGEEDTEEGEDNTSLDSFVSEANEQLKNMRDVKLGDKYSLGKHILVCGDSFKVETYDELVKDVDVSMVFTDPPYNYDSIKKAKKEQMYKGMDSNGKAVKTAKAEGLFDFDTNDIEYLFSKGVKSLYFCCNRHDILKYLLLGEKYKYKYDIHVLYKRTLIPIHTTAYLNDVEYILYFRLPGATFNSKLPFEYYKHLLKEYTDEEAFELKVYGHVCEINNVSIEKKDDTDIELEHPTVKPLRLVIPKIAVSSNKGDVVVDMFGGSGTTLIACEKLERACYMVEWSPEYINEIIDRWESYTGQKAVKLN